MYVLSGTEVTVFAGYIHVAIYYVVCVITALHNTRLAACG